MFSFPFPSYEKHHFRDHFNCAVFLDGGIDFIDCPEYSWFALNLTLPA